VRQSAAALAWPRRPSRPCARHGAGANLHEALDQATTAAEDGMNDTIPLLALEGRASYLGQRSIGHQGPGATSSHLLIRTMADMAREKS
jgi:dihydroxyacetone kinase-like protein